MITLSPQLINSSRIYQDEVTHLDNRQSILSLVILILHCLHLQSQGVQRSRVFVLSELFLLCFVVATRNDLVHDVGAMHGLF